MLSCRDRSFVAALSPLLLLSLGCIPFDFLDLTEPEVEIDDEEVRERRMQRDDPSSSSYRGRFEARIDGPFALTLDASLLGETTYAFVPAEDSFFGGAHCSISLVDRETDDQGRQGYLIFEYYDPVCDPTGTYMLVDYDELSEDELSSARDTMVIKTLQLTEESPEATEYVYLLKNSGTLTITRHDDGVLHGEFSVTSEAMTVEDELKEERHRLEGDFEAIWLPLDPDTPAPR